MVVVGVGREETMRVLREWAERTFSGLLFAMVVVDCVSVIVASVRDRPRPEIRNILVWKWYCCSNCCCV